MNKKPISSQDFSKSLPQTYDDGRLDAPAFHRNHGPIRACLNEEFTATGGNALEVGSGTGQHIMHFAADHPETTWWPSDITDSHLKSIEAWRKTHPLPNLRPPISLDVSKPDWTLSQSGRPPKDDLALIISLNVIHISAWNVTEGLFNGANKYLQDTGQLFLYGPFSINGEHTAESNERFDESLRARNPDWGVRDMTALDELAAPLSLSRCKTIPMPANNFVLIFVRT